MTHLKGLGGLASGTSAASPPAPSMGGRMPCSAQPLGSGAPGAPAAEPSPADDVVNALLALGYSDKEAAAVCRDLPADLPLNDSIRQALKLLSKAK